MLVHSNGGYAAAAILTTLYKKEAVHDQQPHDEAAVHPLSSQQRFAQMPTAFHAAFA